MFLETFSPGPFLLMANQFFTGAPHRHVLLGVSIIFALQVRVCTPSNSQEPKILNNIGRDKTAQNTDLL